MQLNTTTIGHVVQAIFHSIPLIIAAKIWYEHDKFKKENNNNPKKLDKILDHVDENTNMTFTILKLLLFITIYVSVDTFTSLITIQSDTASSQNNTEKILAEIESLKQIKANTDQMVTCIHFPNVDSIKNKFNPVLAKTFSSYIDENAAFFKDGITHGRVTFQMDRFPTAYNKSMDYLNEKYANSQPTLLATSLPSANYFWTYGKQPLRPTELKIKDFIKKGGIIKRIFFVEENYQEDSIAMSILNRQKDSMGVQHVFIILNKYVRNPKYFVVSEQKEFLWDLVISNKERIDYGTYYTSQDDISDYLKTYNDIENNPNIIEFRKE